MGYSSLKLEIGMVSVGDDPFSALVVAETPFPYFLLRFSRGFVSDKPRYLITYGSTLFSSFILYSDLCTKGNSGSYN